MLVSELVDCRGAPLAKRRRAGTVPTVLALFIRILNMQVTVASVCVVTWLTRRCVFTSSDDATPAAPLGEEGDSGVTTR